MSESDRHIKTAEAAEKVRLIVEGESLLDQMRAAIIEVGAITDTFDPGPGILPGGFKDAC